MSDNLVLANLLTGALMPLLVALVVQSKWHVIAKSAVAVASCAVAGVVTAVAAGDLTGQTFASGALIVLALCGTTYMTFWKTTGIAPWIEKFTNITR